MEGIDEIPGNIFKFTLAFFHIWSKLISGRFCFTPKLKQKQTDVQVISEPNSYTMNPPVSVDSPHVTVSENVSKVMQSVNSTRLSEFLVTIDRQFESERSYFIAMCLC